MESTLNVVALAVSLIAGITIGARLSRANSGFFKSLALQILLFVGIFVACCYLNERPATLACVVCLLASIIAAWLGCKTAPDTVSSSYANGHFGAEAGGNPFTVTSRDNPFERKPAQKEPWSWTNPMARFRRPHLPSRITPTGQTIRLVSATDTVPPGKRSRAALTSVK